MSFTEDPDVFLDTEAFAVDATYDGATAVKVIFDNAYLEGVGIGGTNPVATGKASDFPAGTSIGKTLAIGATTYTIRGREPVDDGLFVMLQLEAA
jgi:hypothetical protein